MRDTIDFGIDLGTTNSAIAVLTGDEASIIKNNDGWDTTPSAVYLRSPDEIYVGRDARRRAGDDPRDAAAEFKLEMGLDTHRDFARAGVRMTPPQLSAEILKSLRQDAAAWGAAPDAAVITVPAAFGLNQNRATSEAAELAGFDPACPLLQEPTAAAFAHGFHERDDRARWMVFDFGGGTFDAAVVSKRDGDLQVLHHAGDPYLGGKLIDWAVVERLLAPAVVRDLGLPALRRDDPAQLGNFAELKNAAEQAKIQLSRRESVSLELAVDVGGGRRETFEYTLRRGELDALAEPFYVRAVNLCRGALREASLDAEDLDRLLLVGGVTLSPGLRELLADPRRGLGVELETRLDPSTVVARGAAVFAGTVRHPRTVAPAAPTEPGRFALDLSYEPSVTTTRPTIAGRVLGNPTGGWPGYTVTLSNPAGQPPFRSPRIALNERGAFAAEVYVDARTTSRFTVELFDATGTPLPLAPDSLTLTHRDVEFEGVRLPHSVGIALAEGGFVPLVPKGASLPATERRIFRTTAVLRRADPDAVLRIPIVQGERARAERNRPVGMLAVRAQDVRDDVPADTEVEVTFEVGASSLSIEAVAEIPLAAVEVEAEIDLNHVPVPDQAALTALLGEVETRLGTVRAAAAGAGAQARERLARLDTENTLTTVRDQVRAGAVDAGAAATAEERIRDLHAEIDEVEDRTRVSTRREELRAVIAEVDPVVARHGTAADRQELDAIRRRADEAIAAGDPVALDAQTEQAAVLQIEVERRQPDWPAQLFHKLAELFAGHPEAQPLLREGRRAVKGRDQRAIDAVNQRLVRLLPQDQQDTMIGLREA